MCKTQCRKNPVQGRKNSAWINNTASFAVTVSNYVVLEAIFDLISDHAGIHEALLAAVRPESHNSPRPGARHPGDLEQLSLSGMIDVDSRLRRYGICRGGFGRSVPFARLLLWHRGQTQVHDCDRS